LAAGAAFCIAKYVTLREISNSNNSTSSTVQFKLDVNYYLSLSVTWLVFAIIILILLVIVILLLIFLFQRMRLAIQLIKEASKAVTQIFIALLFPTVPMLLQLVFLAYFVSVAVVLAASGKSLFKISSSNSTNTSSLNLTSLVNSFCDPKNAVYGKVCKFYKFGADPGQAYASAIGFFYQNQWLPQLFNVFMFFWVQSFLVGLNQMILAGSFATWYWSRGHAHLALFVSIKDAFVYHLGSVAFGYFLEILTTG
jgi:choline transporter-like protein 2/4/5